MCHTVLGMLSMTVRSRLAPTVFHDARRNTDVRGVKIEGAAASDATTWCDVRGCGGATDSESVSFGMDRCFVESARGGHCV